MSSRSSLVSFVVTLALLAGLRGSAAGISLAKHCQAECGPAITKCITDGGKKAKCRRQTLKKCRKQGLSICLAATTTTTVTTTTSTTSTTSTTVPAPPPSIDLVDPDNGLVNRPTPNVTITGTGFQTSARVTTAGVLVPLANCDYSGVPTTIVCTVPAGSTAVHGSVVVRNPDQQTDTAAGAWTYTRVLESVDFCNVQFPKSRTAGDLDGPLQVNHALQVSGRVVKIGLTDVTPNAAAGIVGQLGLSPVDPSGNDLNPTLSNVWRYVDAIPNPDFDFRTAVDEYVASIMPTVTGSYRYVYRFSVDGGLSYNYCDADDENDGFDPFALGALDVVP